MFILGLQGSPRVKGNTRFLLSAFMTEAEKLGVRTHVIDVNKAKVAPCRGCGYCEKHGVCIIDDEMKTVVNPLLRQADVIVLATPIFFYNATGQVKIVIDRSQTFWSRHYKLNLADPARNYRRGFLLSLGATRGKNLFDGLILTAKYFFDAAGAGYNGSLTYHRIEEPGDMEKHSGVLEDVKREAVQLISPLLNRKKILFACRENACRSQMAAAFAQHLAGGKIEAFSAGSSPAAAINPVMEEVMGEKGLDMAFRRPQSIEAAVADTKPDIIVTMGCGEACPAIPGAKHEDWALDDPAGQSIDFMRNIRDDVEKKVQHLVDAL